MKKVTISGTGSAMADFLYTDIRFSDTSFTQYLSRSPGDGGLFPGKLSLTEDFENFAGKSLEEALGDIVGNRPPDSFNLGGPSIVALINAAQLMGTREGVARFYSRAGTDQTALRLRDIIRQTPVDLTHFHTVEASSPFTYALSDPSYNDGMGERAFINNIGAAWKVLPSGLEESFFSSDIAFFGGTALVPPLHNSLSSLLKKAKSRGCITIVATVFDFISEKKDPDGPWPLGDCDESYRYTDVLLMDREEALRLSGATTLDAALDVLLAKGASAAVVTNGPHDVVARSGGALFAKSQLTLPISQTSEREKKTNPVLGDTTGCGDNFAGGFLYSIAQQLKAGTQPLNFADACAWGIASGDFACMYLGGTYLENKPGEKREKIKKIYRDYCAARGSLLA